MFVRLQTVAASIREQAPGIQLPYLALEHVASAAGKLVAGFEPEIKKASTEVQFRRGDVLFGKLRPYLAKVIAPDFDGIASGEFIVLRPTADLDSRFLYYLCLSQPILDWADATSVGTKMPRTDWDQLSDFRFTLPSLTEQRAIANFLSRETSQIDDLVEHKRLLAGFLRQRIATISADLVRHGLEANRLTDSQIPTLGDVPSDWQLCRNKNILSEVQEFSESGAEELLSVSHLTGVTPRSEKEVSMFMPASLVGYKRVRAGDLVINTMWAWMGALGVSSTTGLVSPGYGVYRFNTASALPSFYDLFYRTPAYVAEMTRFSRGVWTSRLRLYPEVFLGLRTVVPPMAEQEAIVLAVRDATHKSRKLLHALEESITLLLTRRRALITAAVTNQTDSVLA